MKEEKLFRAIGDVGSDLIDMAEKQTFAPSRWRKWGSVAACLAVLVGLAALAMPYLQTGGGPASTADTAASTAAPQAAAEAYTDVDPLDTEEEMEDTSDDLDFTVLPEDDVVLNGIVPLASREQLVFEGVIYYVEALYTDEEAQGKLGMQLGTVEDADDRTRIGEAVYRKLDSDVRDGVPLEIFVLVEDGYLYCLTYYASAGAYCTFDEAQEMLENGGEEMLLSYFVAAMEQWFVTGLSFEDPSELTSVELIDLFQVLLEQQASTGYRSRDLYSYLWFQTIADLPEGSIYNAEGGCYAIPLADITGVLDQYLDGYTLDLSEAENGACRYDAGQNAMTWPTLQYANENVWLRLREAQFDSETQTMVLTVERYEDETWETLTAVREYTIRFENGCCYYDSILSE